MVRQIDLFAPGKLLPEGFCYRDDLIGAAEERELIGLIEPLPFREFEFHGYLGKRRVVSFGWKYDFEKRRITKGDDMPAFLHPLRAKAAAFAGLEPASLQMALVSEYQAGAGIGWHRDKKEFGDVIGVSLLSECPLRLRRKAGTKWERVTVNVRPRSAYLLRGPSRSEWEHSIAGVDALRYSITFRNLVAG